MLLEIKGSYLGDHVRGSSLAVAAIAAICALQKTYRPIKGSGKVVCTLHQQDVSFRLYGAFLLDYTGCFSTYALCPLGYMEVQG